MAQLPPDGTWLMQMVDNDIILFHRHTEEEILRVNCQDRDAIGKAQLVIHESDRLTPEQKCFAHFWCGYFYGATT